MGAKTVRRQVPGCDLIRSLVHERVFVVSTLWNMMFLIGKKCPDDLIWDLLKHSMKNPKKLFSDFLLLKCVRLRHTYSVGRNPAQQRHCWKPTPSYSLRQASLAINKNNNNKGKTSTKKEKETKLK